MKRKIILILTMCFLQFTYSQTARKELITKVCECFENKNSKTNFEIDPFQECFDFSSEEYNGLVEKIIMQEIDTSQIDNKTSFEFGYEYGQNLFNEIQKPLLEECSSYFVFVKEMKKFLVANTSKGINESKIDSLRNKYRKENWSPDEIFLIGGYELNQGNYDSAINVFKDCIEKNTNHLGSNFYLALAYDLSGKYDLAIEVYRKVVDFGHNPIASVARIFLEASIIEKN